MHHKQVVFIISSVHGWDDVRIYYKEAKSLCKVGYIIYILAKHGNSRIHTTWDYFEIKILALKDLSNRLFRFLYNGFQVFLKSVKFKANVYHFHDPELILLGILLKIIGKKVIYDVNEDVPKQMLGKKWIWRPLRASISSVFNFFEKKASHYFDAVVAAATSSIAESFMGKIKMLLCITIQSYQKSIIFYKTQIPIIIYSL